MDAKEYQRTTEHNKREQLRKIKPKVVEKFERYEEKHARGEITPVIEFTYDYRCNMHCPHCSNLSFTPKDRVLTPEIIRKVSREADSLGLAQMSISGGEPLLFPDFEEVVNAIDPQRFHISVSTNGSLLTEEKAFWMKRIGVDKVKISLDGIDENETYFHDAGQTISALQALKNADNAGLQATAQTVVTHQNCCTNNTERIANYCQKNNYQLDVLLGKAIGRWEGREEILIDGNDLNYLKKLHQEYPVVHLDTHPTYGESNGTCGAVKKILVITRYGDVLPCVFIHISLGNIFDDNLAVIFKRGLTIKHFANSSPVCLSGFNRQFIKKYMSKFYGKPLPVDYREIFTAEDFIDGANNYD